MAKYQVTIDFVDHNSVWREHGTLTIEKRGDNKFFMLANKHGNRVFPLSQRRAEIYFEGNNEAFTVECNYNMDNAETDLASYAPRSIASLLDYGLYSS